MNQKMMQGNKIKEVRIFCYLIFFNVILKLSNRHIKMKYHPLSLTFFKDQLKSKEEY